MTDDDTPDFGALARAMRRTVQRCENERRLPRRMVENCGVGDTWAVQVTRAPDEHTEEESPKDAQNLP